MTRSTASPIPSTVLSRRRGLRMRGQLIGTCLLVAIAVGDYYRWQTASGNQRSFGAVTPMAPATEWVLVILGIALGLHLCFPARRLAHRLAGALSAIAASAVLHVIFSEQSGRTPAWESWLGSNEMIVRGFSIGHMTTQTATLALCSIFALWALLSPPAGRAIWRDFGMLAALGVETFGLVTVVSYAAGNPPVSNAGWLKMAPLVMTEFALFNFLLLMGGGATNRMRHWFFGTDDAAPDLAPISREERQVIVLLAAVGIMALAASLVYLRVQTRAFRERSLEAMQRIADLKVGQIEQWRHERFGDANSLMRLPGLSEGVGVLREPGPSLRQEKFIAWLRNFIHAYGYADVVVFDATFMPVWSGRTPAEITVPELRNRLSALRPDSGVIELPPYPDSAGNWRWDLLVPVPSSESGALAGAILLQTNPTHFINPILQSWPSEYQTGQSMLWNRDGDRLVSLGGYRPAPGTTPEELRPFGMTRSLTDPRAQSMLTRVARGEMTSGEDFDHRGVLILGLGRPVVNSPWLVSSRVDCLEVYAPLRRTAVAVAGIVAGLFVTTGFTTSWLWRQRQKDLLHDRVTAELEQKRTAARLGAVMRHAKDIILLLDADLHVLDANQRAIEAYGWSRDELLKMTIHDLRVPEAPSRVQDVIASAVAHDGAVFETLHRRRDGSTFPAEASVRSVEIDGQPHLLSILRDITERKLAEAQLRDSEEKFSKAFQANPSGIAISDLVTGSFIEANESFCRLMGFAPNEVVGHTSVELAIWGDAAERNRMFRPLLDGHEVRNLEMDVRTRGGELKTIVVNAEPIELNGRRCVVSLIEDISDRKRAEAALRASEERYRLIAENTSDVIWLYDLAADQYSYVSPSVFAHRGFRPQEVVGQKLLTSLAPDSAAEVNGLVQDWLAGRAADDRSRRHAVVEVEQRRKDGSFVPTEVVASLLSDAAGRPTHILGISRDITERRRAREALEKFNTELETQVETRTAELAARNREIEALVGSIPDTVLLCDERGELVTSHFAQSRASSFPFAGFGGSDGLSGQHPVLLEIARELHAIAWASQSPIMLEFDRNIAGVDYSIEARATPAGESRLLILLRDISARKRGERAAQANLERERQLSAMKSQFISVASHEFRTPLAAATGSLELLERHSARITEAKRAELLSRAQRSLGRLTTIMDNVLQLGRADSGRVKVKRMVINLVQFVQDIIREVGAGDRQQHAFAFNHSGDADAVPVDPNLLNHILSNLLGNAVRYSPAATRITVTLELGGQAYSITIADEGIGVPEAERERVFEPFARGSNVGQINGTGLGLNIVKRYTEMLGGSIELLPTSSGATFRVNLPWLPAEKIA